MYYIGLMSGTSMDAVDCALVEFSDEQTKISHYQQYAIDQHIRNQILSITPDTPQRLISQLDVQLGHLFADAVLKTIEQASIDKSSITAIGSHGQTILHIPDGPNPTSIQIGDPNVIASETGITTVVDFRRMDMAAGGQGAPLTPAFHHYQFHHPDKNRVILNIGGMANITILPKDKDSPIIGFDTGPGNILLDEWSRKHKNISMDKNGAWAISGACHQQLLSILLIDDYLLRPPPKSTGREYFNLDWLQQHLEKMSEPLATKDTQASLLEFTSETISTAIKQHAPVTDEVLVCGGGVHNTALMTSLRDKLTQCIVVSTETYDIDPDCIEAVTFAWLAKQRLDGKPANLPSVTGASKATLLGAIYDVSS